MKPASRAAKKSFFQDYVKPLLLIVLIPGFSVWFFPYAESRTDAELLTSLEAQIRNTATLPPARKDALVEFYRRRPFSDLMASSDAIALQTQAAFQTVATRYAVFRWMNRIAWACLATTLATLLIVGLSVAFSARSQAAQYQALRLGLPVLRTSAAIQVVGQSVLAVLLSFWVTAIFSGFYFIKVVAIIGALAFFAVLALLKAIFTKAPTSCAVEGDLVTAEEAPALWQRVNDLCAKLKIAPPDRIIVGIVPNFFVTEHPVQLSGQTYKGRTLYLSLPMLKVLSLEEADAILGHELAHFHGQDTLWAAKVGPMIGSFALYLGMLQRGLTALVAGFMFFFWRLYGLSIQKLSRTREFRADWVAAKLVSPEAMKRALIKVTGYCEYRAKTEKSILEKQKVDKELNLSRQLEEGYPAFLSAFTGRKESINQEIPHPFDSHPPLRNRLERLGFEAPAALLDAGLHGPVKESWREAIRTAPALEEKMWAARQEKIQSVHGANLALRLTPKDEEDVALIQERFPAMVFRKKDGTDFSLEYDRIFMTGWKAPILMKDIAHAVVNNTLTTQQLMLFVQREGEKKPTRTKFHPSEFKSEKGDLLALFQLYYARHKNAEAAAARAAEQAAEEKAEG